MKRKLALFQLIVLSLFGVLIFVAVLNRRIIKIDWKDVTEEVYGLKVLEVFSEEQFELRFYGEWDELGFDRTVFETFYEAPLDAHPDAMVNVAYVLTDQGEKLIYSYPYIYKRQKEKDFVHIVSDVIITTKDQMRSHLTGNDMLTNLLLMIETNQFVILPAFRTSLNSEQRLHEIINQKMQDVLFFQTYDDNYIFFDYDNVFYVIQKINQDEMVCLYPVSKNLDDFIDLLEVED